METAREGSAWSHRTATVASGKDCGSGAGEGLTCSSNISSSARDTFLIKKKISKVSTGSEEAPGQRGECERGEAACPVQVCGGQCGEQRAQWWPEPRGRGERAAAGRRAGKTRFKPDQGSECWAEWRPPHGHRGSPRGQSWLLRSVESDFVWSLRNT